MRFRSSIVGGAALGMETSYSLEPILDVPVGRIRFCTLIALTTSSADSPFDCNSVVLRSTCTWRCFPPYGYGTEAPGTVIRRVRTKLSVRSFSVCSENPVHD